MDDWNTLSAQELVDGLAGAGIAPEPGLLTALLNKGPEAVAPLRALLRREPESVDEEEALAYAVELIPLLDVPETLVDIVSCYRNYPDAVYDVFEGVFPQYGAAAIDPLIELGSDPNLSDGKRSFALENLETVLAENQEHVPRVIPALRNLLHALLEDSTGPAETEEVEWLFAALISLLAAAQDTEARPLIQRVLEAKLVSEFEIAPSDVEELYEQSFSRRPAEWRTDDPRGQFLRTYTDWYQSRQEREAHARLAKLQRLESFGDTLDLEPEEDDAPPLEAIHTAEPIRHTGPAIGRNDPCWCGSGKKYKKCHLAADQAQS